MTDPAPARGEIWDVNFDPTLGREQAGTRPALIVSVDIFNRSQADLVVVTPLTRAKRNIRWHIDVAPPEGGLVSASFILCENTRSVSKARLKCRRGRVSDATMIEVEDRLRILLGL